jgi:hypothetical protein
MTQLMTRNGLFFLPLKCSIRPYRRKRRKRHTKKKSSVDGHISYSVVSYSCSFSLVYASGDVAADGERNRVRVPRRASSLGREGVFLLRTRSEVLTYPYRLQTDLQAHTRLKQQALSHSLNKISTRVTDMAVTGFLDTDRCSPVDFNLSLWTIYVIIICN